MTSLVSKLSICLRIAWFCCFLDLIRLQRVSSFVVNGRAAGKSCPNVRATTTRTFPVGYGSPPFFFNGSYTASLHSVVSDNNDGMTTRSNDDTKSDTGGFFWDFRGHSCYAEVAKPAESKNGENENKPVVLLIHGFACSTLYWRETRAYLTKAGYTVHSVDLLGQGKSSKPGRKDNIIYSIDLWAKMVDEYARRHIDLHDGDSGGGSGVVLVGNSLGSTVALSATSGDCYNDEANPSNAYLPSRVKGLCFYNCGVGLNTRNALKAVSSVWLKTILSLFFDVLNLLVFNNKALLTYVLDEQVSKDVIRNALLSLYAGADDPQSRVDDDLVDSFINPVLNDPTSAVVEVLSQIYTNDAGRTPMEMHSNYSPLNQIPIHLIWGTKDPIAPVVGDVGTFYSKIASTPNSNVSIQLIKDAGHVPFDERPECNSGLIEWLSEKIEN